MSARLDDRIESVLGQLLETESFMPVATGATKDESAHAKGDNSDAWYTPSPPSPLPRAGEGRSVASAPAIGRGLGEGGMVDPRNRKGYPASYFRSNDIAESDCLRT